MPCCCAPLPFADPDRLVMVWEDASFAGFPRNTPAAANYADMKAQNQVFEGDGCHEPAQLQSDRRRRAGESRNLRGDRQFLSAARRASPRSAASFLPEEDKPGANKVVVLSYSLWQQRYGGEPNIVGRELLLSGEKHTVVGVMPAGFQFLDSKVGMWVPMAFTPEELASRGRHYLTVVARLKPGVTRGAGECGSENDSPADCAAIIRKQPAASAVS